MVELSDLAVNSEAAKSVGASVGIIFFLVFLSQIINILSNISVPNIHQRLVNSPSKKAGGGGCRGLLFFVNDPLPIPWVTETVRGSELRVMYFSAATLK